MLANLVLNFTSHLLITEYSLPQKTVLPRPDDLWYLHIEFQSKVLVGWNRYTNSHWSGCNVSNEMCKSEIVQALKWPSWNELGPLLQEVCIHNRLHLLLNSLTNSQPTCGSDRNHQTLLRIEMLYSDNFKLFAGSHSIYFQELRGTTYNIYLMNSIMVKEMVVKILLSLQIPPHKLPASEPFLEVCRTYL